MPISSGAGGKPNSYFNPANALARRSSVPSLTQQASGTPGYYYGSYGNYVPTPRSSVQVIELPDDRSGRRISQNSRVDVERSGGRRCCPCPSRNRKEMRMPIMPKGRHTPTGSGITRRGCLIFLLGLLALAVIGGLAAGLYFLITGVTDIRAARAAFYLIPGRRAGDLMWIVYGQTEDCDPSTTTVGASTTTTLIPCTGTTFSYVQVTLAAAGVRALSLTVWAAAASAVAMATVSRHLLN